MKTAIFNYEGKAPNRGGPTGYLDNLYNGFSTNNKPDFVSIEDASISSKIKNGKKKKAHRFPLGITLRSILFFYKRGFIVKKIKNKLKQYDIIHVHCCEAAFYIRHFCGFKGKIVLTPHRPETFANESIGAINKNGKRRFFWLKLFCNHIEKKAYKFSDYFIFPSEGARSIYYNFPGFKKGSRGKKTFFLLTGINKKKPTIEKECFRNMYGIDNNSILISYIGRHNMIKGYDRLTCVFEKIKSYNINVAAAGAPNESIAFPKDTRWHELGYISDSQNLICASDIIVVPNRNTYFDLVIVEALSQGKIVLTSNTGGNMDISKHTKGLVLFDNSNESSFYEKLIYIIEMTNYEKKALEQDNMLFYENHCTTDRFANNYILIMNNIIEIIENEKKH